MKTLCLIRHAKSSWKNPELSDRERPLKKRGKKDARIMRDIMRDKDIYPDLIITSPAVRARTTAEMFAEAMEYGDRELQIEPGLYFSGPEKMLEVIQGTDDLVKVLFVFGHNPDLTELANQLINTRIENVPTTGIVCIDLEIDHWMDATRKNAGIRFFEYPKMYRG